jgi:hypothetical protein
MKKEVLGGGRQGSKKLRVGRAKVWCKDGMKPDFTEPMLAAAAGWPVVHEARKIRAAGKVLRAGYEPPLVRGAVRSGSKKYAAGLKIGPVMENLCSCFESWSEGKVCAHSVAVALVVLQGPGNVPQVVHNDASQATPTNNQ